MPKVNNNELTRKTIIQSMKLNPELINIWENNINILLRKAKKLNNLNKALINLQKEHKNELEILIQKKDDEILKTRQKILLKKEKLKLKQKHRIY